MERHYQEVVMMEYIFGTIPKAKINIADETITVKKVTLNYDEIKSIFYSDASLAQNGQVFISTDGIFAATFGLSKQGFYYTKFQSDKLKELLDLLENKGIEITKAGTTGIVGTSVSVKIISGKEQVHSKEDTKMIQKQNGIISIGGVPYDYLGFDWNEQKYRSGGKAVAGAVIGGVLTGGLGTLVGAAMGGKRRDNSKATIHLEKDNRSIQLIIECDVKKAGELGKLITK